MSAIPRDTSRRAAIAVRDALRSMGAERRLEAALEMSEEMRRIVEDGVRSRGPSLSAEEVRLQVMRILYGPRLAALASGASRG